VPRNGARRAARFAVYLASAFAACDEVVGPPDFCNVAHEISRLTLEPSPDTILVRFPARLADTVPLTAQAFGRLGDTLAEFPLRFISSSDSTVALVSELGTLLPLAVGTAQITAQACDEKATATITVLAAVSTIIVTPQTVTAVAGDTVSVTASALDPFGNVVADVRFSFFVSDPTAARVEQTSDTTARVIFLQSGTLRVIATAEGVTSG
jgi:hypothetical protein